MSGIIYVAEIFIVEEFLKNACFRDLKYLFGAIIIQIMILIFNGSFFSLN